MEALYIAMVVALCYLNTAATIWTLAVPLVITSFALMLGNWYAAPAHRMPLHLAMLDTALVLQLASILAPCVCLTLACHKLAPQHSLAYCCVLHSVTNAW